MDKPDDEDQDRPEVAPLAGSVDRNIYIDGDQFSLVDVAPLAGSVDRNSAANLCMGISSSRSPRGERG